MKPLRFGDGLMRWFGEPWNTTLCVPETRIKPPLGYSCQHCEEPIAAGEDGVAIIDAMSGNHVPLHYECFMRRILGSVGHIAGHCSCYGGAPDAELDPEAMTPRQAAQAAFRLWVEKQRQR